MMSKYFKGKKANLSKPADPRALDVITNECNQECWALGQLEYQVYVMQLAIEEKNKRIQYLNNEGAARKKLDDANKPKEEVQAQNG